MSRADAIALNNMWGIKRIRCPVLIVHGTEDSVVPYQVTRQLSHLFASPVF
jgi:pimeloyl-ACP methyl ester carboxylesterase